MPDDRDLERRLSQLEGWKAFVDEWRHSMDEWRRNMERYGPDHPTVHGGIPVWLIALAAGLAAFIIVIGILLLAHGGPFG